MPFIRVEMLPGRSVEQKREMTEVFTREVCRIAKCSPDAVNVVFTEVEAENWGFNGHLFSDAASSTPATDS